MSSVNFDEIKSFICNCAAKCKEKMQITAKNFSDPYTDYDINVTAAHHVKPDSEPVFTRSYKGNFKIHLIDLTIAVSLLAILVSFVRSIRNIDD